MPEPDGVGEADVATDKTGSRHEQRGRRPTHKEQVRQKAEEKQEKRRVMAGGRQPALAGGLAELPE